MPYVKKSEYEKLKSKASALSGAQSIVQNLLEHNSELAKERDLYKINHEHTKESLRIVRWDSKKWERYFKAAMTVFKVEEYIEMPGCFNPMESIEFIVKQQDPLAEPDPTRHYHNWGPDNEHWDYEKNPLESYVVKCSCGASGLMITAENKVTNVRLNNGHNRHAC